MVVMTVRMVMRMVMMSSCNSERTGRWWPLYMFL